MEKRVYLTGNYIVIESDMFVFTMNRENPTQALIEEI